MLIKKHTFSVELYSAFGTVAKLVVDRKMVFNEKFDIPTTMELTRSIHKINWSLWSPYKKFCYFYGVARSICIFWQLPAFRDDQSLSFWSFFSCVYVSAYVLLTSYTIHYYIMCSQFEKSLPCTCLLGPLIAVSFEC